MGFFRVRSRTLEFSRWPERTLGSLYTVVIGRLIGDTSDIITACSDLYYRIFLRIEEPNSPTVLSYSAPEPSIARSSGIYRQAK